MNEWKKKFAEWKLWPRPDPVFGLSVLVAHVNNLIVFGYELNNWMWLRLQYKKKFQECHCPLSNTASDPDPGSIVKCM